MVFFFFKQKTAYEMRISDWSSDVCSSDLRLRHPYLREKQAHLETGALVLLTLDLQLAAHQRGEHAGNGQAQANALVLAHQITALERLEDSLDVFGVDADTRVDDVEGCRLAHVTDPQADLAAVSEDRKSTRLNSSH